MIVIFLYFLLTRALCNKRKLIIILRNWFEKSYNEFKLYYERKVEEGKPKMLLLNSVRNKMVLRLAAVIKNNKPCQKIAA